MYDAILVLGKKLNAENQLVGSSKAMVQRAVELFKEGKAPKVIFSGRWYFKLDPQPITEAQALADYAKSLGLPEEAIVLEEESDSTLSNIYFTKRILQKNNWKSIILINFYPFADRALLTTQKILGPEYVVKLDLIDFTLPEEYKDKWIKEESEKLPTMTEFYKQFKDGDDETIYKGHLEYLENYLANTRK